MVIYVLYNVTWFNDGGELVRDEINQLLSLYGRDSVQSTIIVPLLCTFRLFL